MLTRATRRFIRCAAAAALSAAIVWSAGHVADLRLDPCVTALLTAVFLALDKYLRDAGVYGGGT